LPTRLTTRKRKQRNRRISGLKRIEVNSVGRVMRELRISGLKRIEVNSVGRVMHELSREPVQPGANIQLTIDARLHNFALARLQDHSAAAVVIEVKTGDILS